MRSRLSSRRAMRSKFPSRRAVGNPRISSAGRRRAIGSTSRRVPLPGWSDSQLDISFTHARIHAQSRRPCGKASTDTTTPSTSSAAASRPGGSRRRICSSGPEGVGKRAFAQQLAKALLCERTDAAPLAPCGHCQACIMCDAGSHPDIHVVQRRPGKKFLQIDQFVGDADHRHREGFCHELALRPLMGRRRIGIIDDADWFNAESANSLLKLIEEPPPARPTAPARHEPQPAAAHDPVARAGRFASTAFPPMPLAQLNPRPGPRARRRGRRPACRAQRRQPRPARELADPQLWLIRDRFAVAWRHPGDFDPTPLTQRVRRLHRHRRQGSRRPPPAIPPGASDRRRRAPRVAFATPAAAGDPPDAALAALDRTLEAEEQLDRNANQATLLECWLDDLASIPAI